ncbi:MAG: hypothetical protein JW910_02125 [Anaerolineae bacterium]|nr:hypothetical protein [Anaerolineae bacterium]
MNPVPHSPKLIPVLAVLLLCLGAVLSVSCQAIMPGAATPAPTLAGPVEIVATQPPPTRRPSPTPRPILSATARPTDTITPSPLPTDPFAITPTSPTLTEATVDPTLLAAVGPPTEATLAPGVMLIGRSVQGRGIVARRLGAGAQALLLVGGIHGGFEANTIELMHELYDHFNAAPDEIAPGLALVIIPALNPDGLAAGYDEAARFNAHGVDLNRNWACDWSAEAYWRDQTVPAGAEPFSEPEAAALADYILLAQPAAVFFYHSAVNGIFPGACKGSDSGSQALGMIYGEAASYPSDGEFSAYPITGDASNWVDWQGIPSLTIELENQYETEFERNYAGIMAVQCELARRSTDPAARAWVLEFCVAGSE